MPVQIKHRFTVTEYYRMAETGVLQPDARVELLDGEITDMSPIGPYHGRVVRTLNRFFTSIGERRWVVDVQSPVHLSDHSEPQPDLALLKSPDSYGRRHPRPEDVYLLIEVSDATLDADREVKLPLYGRAGIAEVWIVNLADLTVEVYREPGFNGYASKTILQSGEYAKPLAFPDVAVDVTKLLER